jgi:hypothetical protein
MGSNPIESKRENIVLNNQALTEEIIEYQGYEDFPIVEMTNKLENKQDKIKPNPSLNNHSGGSSIGKYESEHREKQKEDKNNEEENNKMKIESKFHSQNEDINKEKEEKGENDNINNDNKEINNNEVVNNNENNEKAEEDIKKEEINENNNNIAKEEENKNEEEKNENKEENGNININAQENENKEENINNINNINKEEEIPTQQEENNKNNLTNDKNTQQENNMIENKDKNENKENTNMNNNTNTNNNINNHNENVDNNNNIKEEKKNENNKNEEFAPKKIILPDVNTIISEKVLEEGAGNELLFMSNLNKMDHISIKERVRYSEKFCITTKDNFLIYETRENYIKVKKPLAIIPINSIKNVVLFKLTKKIINYDHFYIEFQLDENNRNNVYNQIETFFINDLDNSNNENKGDTALVLFKTEEKNLAKKWYVLLKYLAELKLKN